MLNANERIVSIRGTLPEDHKEARVQLRVCEMLESTMFATAGISFCKTAWFIAIGIR